MALGIEKGEMWVEFEMSADGLQDVPAWSDSLISKL